MPLVFTASNVSIAAAPPSYYLPNAAGSAVPLQGTRGDLAVDLGGSIPSGQSFAFVLEKQVDGIWSDDATADMTTGPYTLKGVTTTVNHLRFEILATDSAGNPVGTRPARWRIRVDRSGAWTIPSVTLSTS